VADLATAFLASDVAADFRGAMRRLASAVAIVVAEGPEGFTGMAATSLTSLTVEPPAVLVCVNRSASLHACIEQGASFTVNILSRHQRDVSAAFGGAVARELRFTVGEWTPDSRGIPMLDDAQANLSCVVDAIMAYGTHSIVVGRVHHVRLTGEVAPLIYQDGNYL
jgi:flavin reductase (DIM6/NTAB) family NADH-FMN oxidoreductase RutF